MYSWAFLQWAEGIFHKTDADKQYAETEQYLPYTFCPSRLAQYLKEESYAHSRQRVRRNLKGAKA
ncbi:hypothetical protein ES703_121772 [subsurface metagenome]